jgi:hypothetical protein
MFRVETKFRPIISGLNFVSTRNIRRRNKPLILCAYRLNNTPQSSSTLGHTQLGKPKNISSSFLVYKPYEVWSHIFPYIYCHFWNPYFFTSTSTISSQLRDVLVHGELCLYLKGNQTTVHGRQDMFCRGLYTLNTCKLKFILGKIEMNSLCVFGQNVMSRCELDEQPDRCLLWSSA